MGFIIDSHLHTRRHSGCSQIDEHQLIPTAIAAGLQGLIITEHHYQWRQEELDELKTAAGENTFLLMAGLEYSTNMGDILVYGLEPKAAESIEPFGDPEESLQHFLDLGAICVAAHPTRALVPFDERLLTMPFDGIEVQSVNIQPHEQRLAHKLAADLGIPGTAASDAHQLSSLGAYAMEFDDPVHSMADFVKAMRAGRFRPIKPGQ